MVWFSSQPNLIAIDCVLHCTVVERVIQIFLSNYYFLFFSSSLFLPWVALQYCSQYTAIPYRESTGVYREWKQIPAMRTGVPCNENRVFPVGIDLQGVPCKLYRVWVCSVVWAVIECMVHVALPKGLTNRLHPVWQRRQQVFKAYCPVIYCVVKAIKPRQTSNFLQALILPSLN